MDAPESSNGQESGTETGGDSDEPETTDESPTDETEPDATAGPDHSSKSATTTSSLPKNSAPDPTPGNANRLTVGTTAGDKNGQIDDVSGPSDDNVQLRSAFGSGTSTLRAGTEDQPDPAGGTAVQDISADALALATPVSAPMNPLAFISGMVSSVLTWLVGPAMTTATPAAPAEPPLLWAVLAWARRQFDSFLANQRPTISHNPLSNSLTTDGSVTGTLVTNDPEDDPLRLTVVEGPSHGDVVVGQDGKFTYTPDAGYRGEDSFVVGVRDGGFHLRGLLNLFNPSAVDNQTLVEVNTAIPNRPPVKLGDPIVGEPDAAGVVKGSFNVKDPDNDQLTPTIVHDPASGGLEVIGGTNPTFTYTPSKAARDLAATTPGEDTDTFTVSLSDGKASVTVDVKVTIAPTGPNAAPEITDDPDVGDPNSLTGVVNGKINARDLDGDTLVYTVVDGPDNGEVTVNDAGEFVYKPSQAARESAARTPGEQIDFFRVQVGDGQTVGGSVLVEVEIGPKIVNIPPEDAQPEIGNPDAVTGVVTGSLGVNDANLDDLVYTVKTRPANGQVTFGEDGTFTYTPTQAGRIRAGLTSGEDKETFTVTVTDGEFSQDVEVEVSLSPARFAVGANGIEVGSNPSGIVFSNGKAFVANRGDGTVSVIDLATRQVVATVPVGAAPSALVVAGNTVYVADAVNPSISMIDAVSNARVDAFPGTPEIDAIGLGSAASAITVSADGKTVYVVRPITVLDGQPPAINYININTTTHSVTSGPLVGVGDSIDMVLSPDGTRMYLALQRPMPGQLNGELMVLSVDANNQVTLGPTQNLPGVPVDVAVAPDGRVIVLDGVNMAVMAPGGALGPSSPSSLTNLAFSPDGSLAYSIRTDNSIDVLDGTTLSKITTIPGSGAMSGAVLGVSPDGKTLYAVDRVNGEVFIISYGTATPPAV